MGDDEGRRKVVEEEDVGLRFRLLLVQRRDVLCYDEGTVKSLIFGSTDTGRVRRIGTITVANQS
jgi:hypothetical protein